MSEPIPLHVCPFCKRLGHKLDDVLILDVNEGRLAVPSNVCITGVKGEAVFILHPVAAERMVFESKPEDDLAWWAGK